MIKYLLSGCKCQSTVNKAWMTVGSVYVLTKPIGSPIKLTFTKWPLSDVTRVPLNVNELCALCCPPLDFTESPLVMQK